MKQNYLKAFLLKYGENSVYIKKYLVGNVYCLPLNGVDDITLFTHEYTNLLNLLRARSNFVYISGDYIIDILKMCSNNAYNTFYENVISCGFAPKITLPTRICDTASTLIDNVYTNVLDKSHISGILIRSISDLQMYFCVMNANFRKPVTQSKHIEVEILNEDSISNFQNKIAKLEIHNKLDKNPNKDPNYNYEILSPLLQKANTFQNKF